MPDDAQGPPSDRSAEARPMLRLALIAALATAVAAGTSRALRSVGDPPPAAIDGIATALAVVSVLLLLTTFGSAVLWVLVRFLGPPN
jgi:hypothetical protein